MSVYVAVTVNGDEVLTLQARRVTNTRPRVGGTPQDEVNRYEVHVFNTFRQQAVGPALFTVKHRYGDGIVRLTRKVLRGYERLDIPPLTH